MSIIKRIRSMFNHEETEAPVRAPISYEAELKTLFRNSIRLDIAGPAVGRTHFGGTPDVPAGFVWPSYALTDCYPRSDAGKIQPLSFIAQFDCAALAPLDKDNLLPQTGLLSIFYDVKYQPWEDCGEGTRIFWFENISDLRPAAVPPEAPPLPALNIHLTAEPSLPDWETFDELHPGADDCDQFEEDRALLDAETPDECSKLLGWPDSIQNSVFESCKDGDWMLLFQLDTVTDNDFELMFGDSGRIYLLIRREDLAAQRFEKIRMTLQCY